MNLIGYLLGNRYKVLEKIGNGGMAVVYKAHCTLLNRYVAIKVLKEEYANDENIVKKFMTEAQSAASLSHPNIVSIYDVGKDNDIYYIVMELVEGKTLKQYIEEKGKIYWKDACEIAYEISQGLGHAHKNHIIHRDIKPHNIVLTNDMKIKVTDFGIAKAVTATTKTISDDTMGSVHYFSPEQAKGGFTTDKSDIYSLGIVMYEMLTGVLPFNAETSVAIALKHVQEIAKSPSEIDVTIPISVSNIVMKAIQKDPSLRYNNISEFALDLKLVLDDPKGQVGQVKNYDNYATQKIEPIKVQDINNKKYESAILRHSQFDEFVKNSKEDKFNNKSKKVEEEKNINVNSDRMKHIEKKKKGKRIRRVIFITLLGLMLFGGTFYLALYYSGAFDRPNEVLLPNLVNENVESATKTLEKLGLELIVASQIYDSTVPVNCIISQDPVGPKNVKVGRQVNVVVSKGPIAIPMPDITDLSVDDAIFILYQHGLDYELIEETSLDIDKGEIIKCEYATGDIVEGGSKIKIYVSSGVGDGKVKMPKLVGKTEGEVREILLLNNLVLKEPITYKSNPEYGNNIVLFQSVSEGSIIHEGDEISIEVNKTTVVPEEPIPNTNISYSDGKVKIDLSNITADKINVKVLNDMGRILVDKDYLTIKDSIEITIVDNVTKYIEVYINNNISARYLM